ncbi:MAG TPA: response regulator [Candidatus Margulisiibacteriota bacterium]|nr:response regulator [Candidatus Margulisiibacteriota bacterium]
MKDTALIVGQDANARRIARTLLYARNMNVLSVASPLEACDIICCEGAAVVVLDLTFPDTKGLEVLRRLRGRFETRILPTQPRVIVVADWPESAVERLAVGLGADAFLRKPVAARDLLNVVDRVVLTGNPAPMPAAAHA